jgi:hypothetical protein
MLCHNLKIYNIYNVVLINRKNIKNIFVFAGNFDNKISQIFRKIEKNTTLSKDDDNILKNTYQSQYKFLFPKQKYNSISYINDFIYNDDSINNIRNKIFAYLSQPSNNIFYQENFQELWVYIDGKPIILGTYYQDVNFEPSINNPIEVDNQYFVDKSGKYILKLILRNENNRILQDFVDDQTIDNNSIYLHDLNTEKEYLNENKIKIDELLIKGYIEKFWPTYYSSESPDKLNTKYKDLRNKFIKEKEIMSVVHETKINFNDFGNCSIINCIFHIFASNPDEQIDLFKIFNFLRLDEKTPFKKYKEADWIYPKYVIYKPLIDNNIITNKTIKIWTQTTKVSDLTSFSDVISTIRGLSIKRYLYESNDGPKYYTIDIYKNGSIEVRLNYTEDYNAGIKNIENAIKDCIQLINKINAIDFRLSREQTKKTRLNCPELYYDPKTGHVTLGKYTTISFIKTISIIKKIDDEHKINYNDLNKFGKIFSPYLSTALSTRGNIENTFTMKYKRISNYTKMSEIFEFITETFDEFPNILPDVIIKLIENKFEKNETDAKRLYREWQKRIGSLGYTDNTKLMKQTGVSIRISKNKIYLNGCKSFYQLQDVSNFVYKMLELFFSIEKKNKNSKELYSRLQKYSKELDLIENNNANYINNSTFDNNSETGNYENIYNYEGVNTSFNEYFNSTNDFTNITQTILQKNINNNSKNQYQVPKDYLATDNQLDKNIRLKCDESVPDKNKDTCTDFCEDEYYALRRLQRYDNPIFHFKKEGYETFGRKCQSTQGKQPMVLAHDPEKDPRIKRSSFTYSIKYGSSPDRQNYYICPRVWCPHEEIPIDFDDVKNSIVKRKLKRTECITALCPSCKEKFKKETWLKIIDENKYNPYPGFLDPSLHPNNLCMPCCQKKATNNPTSSFYPIYLKCTGKGNNVEVKDVPINYVMGRDKIPLQTNRFGLLPFYLSKLFNSFCEAGYLEEDKICFLRQGVKGDDTQSFLQAISSAISTDGKEISKNDFKKYLINILNDDLFDSLKKGLLKILFYDPIKNIPAITNFKKFILSENEIINYEYLWDLLSRPGIIEKDGINIFIITSNTILCPYGENVSEFYNNKRKSIILFTNGKYFEIISKVKSKKNTIHKISLFEPNEPIIQILFDIASQNCHTHETINWSKIFKDQMNKISYPIKEEFSLDETIKKLDKIQKIKGFNIVAQYIDQYNKTAGLILDKNLYLPIKPSSSSTSIKKIFDIPEADANYVFDKLTTIKDLTGINCEPIQYVLDEKNNDLIGLLLENDRIVPVKRTKIDKKLPISILTYYANANYQIKDKLSLPDKRKNDVQKLLFENETYERIRFEISRELQNHPNEKQLIKNIINDSNNNIPKRRNEIKSIISKILAPIISVKDKINVDFNTYKKDNTRKTCNSITHNIKNSNSKNVCNLDSHCIFDNKSCKLLIPKYNLITGEPNYEMYLLRLSEEILRNKIKSDEIINDLIEDIIDKDKIEQSINELIIYGSGDEIKNIIDKLYLKEKEIYINPDTQFDLSEPKFIGLQDLSKYKITNKNSNFDISKLKPLSINWEKEFGENFKYYFDGVYENTLFRTFAKLIDLKTNKITSIRQIKDALIDKIEQISLHELNEPFFKNILTYKISESESPIDLLIEAYKEINKSQFKNINNLMDLKLFVKSDDYYANDIDVYLLNKIYNFNTIILEKRITKTNPYGITFFENNKSKNFVILFSFNINNRKVYYPVQNKQIYVYDSFDIPQNIMKLLKNIDNKMKSQKIKIKIKKTIKNNSNNYNEIKMKVKKIKVTKKKSNKTIKKIKISKKKL